MAGFALLVRRMLPRGLLVAALVLLIIAAIGVPVGGHDNGTTSHLWNGHIKPLATPGTINDAGNPVHWTKLTGVPNGFADGKDNTALPGFGLKSTQVGLAINVAVTQRRVDTACPAGQAIRRITQAGDVVCTRGPKGLSFVDADTGVICNNGCPEGNLSLPAGTWMISAKIGVVQSDDDEDRLSVICSLAAGGLSDTAVAAFSDGGGTDWQGATTLPMQLLADLDRSDTASVSCEDQDIGNVTGRDLSIIAVRLSD